jgi:hypothetical protein
MSSAMPKKKTNEEDFDADSYEDMIEYLLYFQCNRLGKISLNLPDPVTLPLDYIRRDRDPPIGTSQLATLSTPVNLSIQEKRSTPN